jgi:hypothetical protein
MSSLVSSSIYSQNNNNNNNVINLKPSLSTSTHFQTPHQQQQQQQQLLSHSFHGSYYTPSPLSLPSLINPQQQQQQQQPQNSPPKSFPIVGDIKTSSTSALALMATTTVSTPTIATSTTTTTISIQQANTQQAQQHSRALSEPRFQQPKTTIISKIEKPKDQQIETYDNINIENEQQLEPTPDSSSSNDADKHIYGILENKEQKSESTDENEESNGGENLKLKLMQKQLFDLTNMIHRALLNGDLKQLASIEYNLSKKQTNKSIQSSSSAVEDSISYKNTLNGLLVKIKELKVEYQGVKKLQENFSLNINESMKQFVNKLQVNNTIK